MSSLCQNSRHASLIKRYLANSNISQSELARRLNVSQSHVWQWIVGRRRVSPERAAQLEQVTNGAIQRGDFYPELFTQKLFH